MARDASRKGIQQGMQTRNLEIAKEMLKKGYTADVVKELAGLAREALKQL